MLLRKLLTKAGVLREDKDAEKRIPAAGEKAVAEETDLSGKAAADGKVGLDAVFKNINQATVLSELPGYEKLCVDKGRFYYRTEEKKEEFHGLQEADVLKRYGLRHEQKITDACSLYRRDDGEAVPMICEDIPAFDSGDREWDSYRAFFLMPEEGKIKGLLICGGYRVARVLEYEDVKYADAGMKKLLLNIGMQCSDTAEKAYQMGVLLQEENMLEEALAQYRKAAELGGAERCAGDCRTENIDDDGQKTGIKE